MLWMRAVGPVPQDRLDRFEPLRTVTAQIDRDLRFVDEARVHVEREMCRADVQLELPGQLILARRSVHGVRLHRRLNAAQTPDVGKRFRNGVTLGGVEHARLRTSRRRAAVATPGHKHDERKREKPSRAG